LQLEGYHRLCDFQQVRRTPVDKLQRRPRLNQCLALRQHGLRILFSPFHQRHDLVQFRLISRTQGIQPHLLIAVFQTTYRPGQNIRALRHVQECLPPADQRLRNRLRQPLRLHQRLSRGSQLPRHPVRMIQRVQGYTGEQEHRQAKQNRQPALMLGHRFFPEKRQGNQVGRFFSSSAAPGAPARSNRPQNLIVRAIRHLFSRHGGRHDVRHSQAQVIILLGLGCIFGKQVFQLINNGHDEAFD